MLGGGGGGGGGAGGVEEGCGGMVVCVCVLGCGLFMVNKNVIVMG